MFSYDDPSSNRKDALRFLCGDTSSSQPLLHDEEYQFLIQEWDTTENVYLLASYCAEAIAGKFAREINISSDSQTLGASELQDKYLKLAAQLRQRANAAHPGELYVSGMEPGVGLYPGTLPLSFGTGMHDHPEAGQQDYGDAGSYNDNEFAEKWGRGTWG